MSNPSYETGADGVGQESDEDGAGVAPVVTAAPAAMGSGSATPIAAPGALAGSAGDEGDDEDAPEREAEASGERELGGSDGPVGGTPRP